jgi:hypothetical protein
MLPPGAFTRPHDGLPPSPPLWPFQKSLIPTAESIANSLGANPTGVTRIAAWIVRATLLDPRIARQAALDEKGTMDAVGAIALTTLPAILFAWLGAGTMGAGLVGALVTTIAISLASVAGMVALLSALAPGLLGMPIPAARLLRALAYSEGANLFAFVPGLGPLLQVWSIVSGTAAVREISGVETQKAVIFMIAGAVVWAVIAMVLSPILFRMVAGL